MSGIEICVGKEKCKDKQCSMFDCLIPSNKKEFGLRVCLSIVGVITASSVIIFNHSCNLFSIWIIILWILSIMQLLVIIVGFSCVKQYHNRCQFFTKECADTNHVLVFILLLLNAETLRFLIVQHCNTVNPGIRYFLIAITIFRCVQLFLDLNDC